MDLCSDTPDLVYALEVFKDGIKVTNYEEVITFAEKNKSFTVQTNDMSKVGIYQLTVSVSNIDNPAVSLEPLSIYLEVTDPCLGTELTGTAY